MKKTMKKVITMVLAMCMVLAMNVAVFAADATASITAPNNGHTYEAFQIFTGDIADGQLQNIKWGANGTGTVGKYVDATVTNELAALTGSDVTKLATIDNYVNLNSTAAYTIAAGETKAVTPGYYLIRDTGDQVTGDAVATLYIVEVAKDVTIAPKGEKPSVEKKVYEENKGWQDGATYDIGDEIPYKLTATLPDISAYPTYYVQFDDQLCDGLDYVSETGKAATVKIGDVDVTGSFTISYDAEKHLLLVTCDDIKSIEGVTLEKGTQIVVEYKAVLNTEAVIAGTGNSNEVKLVYSNNPNVGQGGDHGTTPEDKVTVWTFKLVADKVDGNGDALKGAGFTLYKGTGDSKTAIGEEVKGTDLTSFEFKGLDEGTYTLVETTVPDGYNQADDVVFTITATYDTEAADPQLKTLTVDNTNVTVKSVASGELDTTIKNYTGATLPTTGGMGTTIFYVVGMILVLGAGVVLIARRRMAR